jgi:WhiB family redox-sensing transcriptional regulator
MQTTAVPLIVDDDRDAKAICAGCPVREECLEYAMRWDQLCGVWGGLSERERRQLRRQRRNGATSRAH